MIPIEMIVEGIVIDVSPEHEANADVPIDGISYHYNSYNDDSDRHTYGSNISHYLYHWLTASVCT